MASHEPGLMGNPVTKKYRVLAGNLTDQFVFICMTKQFVDKSGCKTFKEIIEKKYPFNLVLRSVGSFGNISAELILKSYGLSFDTIKSWGGTVTMTDNANMIDMMKDGKGDVAIDHSSSANPNWTELAMTSNVTMACPEESALKYLRSQGFAPTLLPKGSYNNLITEDTATVGANDVLGISVDVSDDVVYVLTKALCDGKEELAKNYAPIAAFKPEEAWRPERTGDAPLHPGAERYYRDMGWMN
jgi:TRAP transporter TAXI family solute receptor